MTKTQNPGLGAGLGEGPRIEPPFSGAVIKKESRAEKQRERIKEILIRKRRVGQFVEATQSRNQASRWLGMENAKKGNATTNRVKF